jgi:hypothetical protein
MFRSIAFLILLMPLALQVQGSSARISTHILTISPAGLPETIHPHFRTASGIEPFATSGGPLDLPTPYSGPQEFSLYRSKEDAEAAAGGKKSIVPVATISLPEKSDLILLICNRDAEDKLSLSAYSLDSKDLKPGDYRVFNFSKSTISMNLGDQSLELASKKDQILVDPKWHTETLALPLKISTIIHGKTRQVYSSLREHSPQDRTLVFLFDGSHPSRPITFTTFSADAAVTAGGSGKGTSKRSKP